ncbi:hypothetical protein [Hoeflea olei]|uniref:Uncharacterized protein n=1 Tax=Hoeflea olei TaxID=1480615 RepID=A0A1C1YVS0_9HYPH|nr:hypothetical protein [Hoeflea olei]OCW57549.1 hypothetical protein AWJ14_01640 [Hoeflea olei]
MSTVTPAASSGAAQPDAVDRVAQLQERQSPLATTVTFSGTGAAAPVPSRVEPPAWPHPGSVDLVSKLLDLSGTHVARVSSHPGQPGPLAAPVQAAPAVQPSAVSGVDFWTILSAMLPAESRSG